jgi:hypothetical protein
LSSLGTRVANGLGSTPTIPNYNLFDFFTSSLITHFIQKILKNTISFDVATLVIKS